MKYKPDMFKKLLALILTCVLFLSLPGGLGSAKTLDEINKEIQDTQNQKNAAEQQKKSVADQLAETENRLHTLEKDIAVLQDQLTVVEQSRAEAEKELIRVQAELADAEERLEEQRGIMDTRMAGIYKQGDTGYIEVILGSSSFDDFVSRMTYLTMIVKGDTETMNAFREIKDKVDNDREQADTKKQEIIARENAIIEIKAPLDTKKQQVDIEKAGKENLYAQLNSDIASQDQVLADLLKEQQDAAGRRVGGGVRPAAYSFIWPAGNADLITSDYGYRVHPLYGDIRFHYGLDIGVDYEPLLAAASGTVIYVGWDNAVGNGIEIDHGGGVKTRYLHLQTGSIRVSEGDFVSQGQQIATTGNTGYSSTGAHLHFEVYDYEQSNNELQYIDNAVFGGAPYSKYYPYEKSFTVNPLDWLP